MYADPFSRFNESEMYVRSLVRHSGRERQDHVERRGVKEEDRYTQGLFKYLYTRYNYLNTHISTYKYLNTHITYKYLCISTYILIHKVLI